jgi:hypothetical protein
MIIKQVLMVLLPLSRVSLDKYNIRAKKSYALLQ